MAEFTLLELHVEDASFSANTPFSSKKEVVADDEPPESEDSNRKAIAAVVGFVFLVVTAYVIKRSVLSGDGDGDGFEE